MIFCLGRLVGVRGPGLFFLIPGAERMQKTDLRIVTHEVPAQEAILGQSDLDHVLTQRDAINQRLQEVIDSQTSAWGVKVTSVEVRDLELPPSMQRAMARQAEAEREKRAKVIHAEGEFSASQQLAAAAEVIGSQPLCNCATCRC